MPSDTTTAATAEALALIELPAIGGLSQDQVRGITCVWDGIGLAPDTAIDLGERTFKRLGEPVSWYPRGCRRCTGKAAWSALLDHGPKCQECRDNAGGCDLGRALQRLMREGRR